jgi:hypothetical protein
MLSVRRREMHVVWSRSKAGVLERHGEGRGLNFLTHPQRDFAYGGAEKKRLSLAMRAAR